jgi:hypothetical protein
VRGLEHTPQILAALGSIPSTWGVVGGCCAASLEELQARAPDAFRLVEPQLATLAQRRRAYREVLFCADIVRTIGRAAHVELASHGFLHLLPARVPATVLRSDVAASVASLQGFAGNIKSFIPPQNYHWPDEALVGTGIRYVRHTPVVCGFAYSDPRSAAKLARLWNDLISPVSYGGSSTGPALLLFLRIDRGARLWERQLRLIRRLLRSRVGSLCCFSHPHNLDGAHLVRRFAQFCDTVGEAAAGGRLTFGSFFRELPVPQEASR